MARPEDIQRANRLKEIEKEIAELQKGTSSDALARQPQINKLKRESLELSKEIQETDEKIVTSRKAQAKIGQQTYLSLSLSRCNYLFICFLNFF